jgi:hypothetical protein
MVKRKEKDNDLPKTMQKTNDRTTRTPIKTGVNPGAPIGLADPDPIVTPVMLPLNDTFRNRNTYSYRSVDLESG